jgi:subtilisin family serine protease
MAKKKKVPASETAETRLTKEEKEQHRETIAASGLAAERRQVDQRRELRLNMMRSVVTEPLLSQVRQDPAAKFDIIISLNERFKGGIEAALVWVERRAKEWNIPYTTTSHYVFGCVTGQQVLDLADEARKLIEEYGRDGSVVYKIWEDSDVSLTLTKTLITVKADAAQRAFHALGDGIVWAVLDSGVDRLHQHFKNADTLLGPIDSLNCPEPITHRDFTPDGRARNPPEADGELMKAHDSATEDRLGHGTHVAGIIAGCWQSTDPQGDPVAGTEVRDERTDEPITAREKIKRISGVAPLCKIVSLKVIADETLTGDTKQKAGQGKVSWVLMAIDQIQKWNQWGKRILVHGVNMSLGYDFDPRWFACGHSPICAEVDRLVKCGVSVVVSAGNGGYPSFIEASGKAQAHYTDMSITDPGNADLAITVGSTHRDMPHTYGVSYFSSRGPTGDGRLKPDVLAPGERILSCAAGLEKKKFEQGLGVSADATAAAAAPAAAAVPPVLYCEQTGTSMSAPHVSGAVAAFLSVRSEFIGQPERVKELFLSNAVDLGRQRHFQGAGLLDLMKVLQAV